MREDYNPNIEQLMDSLRTRLRERWGDRALMPLGDLPERTLSPLVTGLAALDDALKPNGIPRGQMSMVCGVPSSGAATLCLQVLANAGVTPIIYFDLSDTLDPEYLVTCGLRPADVLVVRPVDFVQALRIIRDLIHHLRDGILFIDLGLLTAIDARQVNDLQRLIMPLKYSACVLLLLVDASLSQRFQPYVAVMLHVRRREWLQTDDDVNGYRSDVEIVKNKGGQSGQMITLILSCQEDAR